MSSTGVRLRPLGEEDEAGVLAAHQELLADDFQFALGYVQGMAWKDYLAQLESERLGRQLPAGRVPATFLVGDAGGEIVGRVSIRHALNAFLAREGGHIGFAVRPRQRRRGYATEMLRQGLVIARSLGINRALVTCDERNAGSIGAIERCGGVLESTYAPPGRAPIRRYWIV